MMRTKRQPLRARDLASRAAKAGLAVVKDALRAWFELCKIMVPIVIIVKVVTWLGLIEPLSRPLAPIMSLVGLPPAMGLAWATAMINNIYGGIIVFVSLIPNTPLTAAQATVLGSMMLVAHSLPLELSIAERSGARPVFQGLMRVAGAIVLGAILFHAYNGLDLLQGPARPLLAAGDLAGGRNAGVWAWAVSEVRNLAAIFLIIAGLLGLMRLLGALGIIALVNRVLRPLLVLIGIGPKASAVTMIGLTLGISYGGGLIIAESKAGNLARRDIFLSLTLMGLCHSLVEDTLLMVMIGGHLSGLLAARAVFALLVTALLARLTRSAPERICARHFWKGQAEAPPSRRAA